MKKTLFWYLSPMYVSIIVVSCVAKNMPYPKEQADHEEKTGAVCSPAEEQSHTFYSKTEKIVSNHQMKMQRLKERHASEFHNAALNGLYKGFVYGAATASGFVVLIVYLLHNGDIKGL